MPLSVALLEATFNILVFASNLLASIDFVLLRNSKMVDLVSIRNRLERMCCLYFRDNLKYDEKEIIFTFVSVTSLVTFCIFSHYDIHDNTFGVHGQNLCRDDFRYSTYVGVIYIDLVATRCLLRALKKSMKGCAYPKIATWITTGSGLERNRGKVLIQVYAELFDSPRTDERPVRVSFF
ncbi:hypothetical protein NQ318_000221 [Aromia moschata]|uniref:Uncharacterized protein n=1 Tax=Aromia moschata TaxID=1265417 RepID=A0AAV8YLN2_9CUCU|nr:hypothetical protein NQ318_000221 [Aromia moschata]